MKKKTPLLIGIAVATVLAIGLVVLLAVGNKNQESARKIDSVKVQKDGNTLDVRSDGRVTFEKNNETFEDFWDEDKLNAFFGYIDGKYVGEGELVAGGGNYIVVNGTTYVLGDDELIDAVEDDAEDGDDGGGDDGDGGDDGGSTPFPTSTSGPSGGGTSPTPAPTSSAPSGGGGPDPECLYWRLSYCVRPRTPSPSPSATPEVVEIREPNCEANAQTGRTVIGNDLCIPTPSPTP